MDKHLTFFSFVGLRSPLDLHFDPEVAKAVYHCLCHTGHQAVAYSGNAIRQGRKNENSMGERFIAREPHIAGQRGRRANSQD
jgi:hypothetical protein